MAWTAVECHHHHHQHNNHVDGPAKRPPSEKEDLELLNRRLRNSLEQSLKLLQNVSESPCLLKACPPDLYTRLVATVDSENFLYQIKPLHEASTNGINYEFSFREAKEGDTLSSEIMVSENYIILNEKHVVEGITNFMAKCVWPTQMPRN